MKVKQGDLVTRNFNDIPLYVEKVDDDNLYVRLDRASLDLPISGAYYNYWIKFDSINEGPGFAIELFHDGNGNVSPTLWDITTGQDDYTIGELSHVNTGTVYIEVMVPKLSINTNSEYSFSFFTHYSNTANTWDDDVSENDNGEMKNGITFQ
jgi:hypothetical protein